MYFRKVLICILWRSLFFYPFLRLSRRWWRHISVFPNMVRWRKFLTVSASLSLQDRFQSEGREEYHSTYYNMHDVGNEIAFVVIVADFRGFLGLYPSPPLKLLKFFMPLPSFPLHGFLTHSLHPTRQSHYLVGTWLTSFNYSIRACLIFHNNFTFFVPHIWDTNKKCKLSLTWRKKSWHVSMAVKIGSNLPMSKR